MKKIRRDQWFVLFVGVAAMLLIWWWPAPSLPEGREVENHPLVLGPLDKPALTIFSWWGCPHCQETWGRRGPLLVKRALKGEIRLVYRPIARTKSEALVSALLYCLPVEEAFARIGEAFAWSRLAELTLRSWDQVRPYLSCMDSRDTLSKLAQDSRAVERWRIQYTPTFFVGGKRVAPEEMTALLDEWAKP